jgi:hypothetical protein
MPAWPLVAVTLILYAAMAFQSFSSGVNPTLAFMAGLWTFAAVDLMVELQRDAAVRNKMEGKG